MQRSLFNVPACSERVPAWQAGALGEPAQSSHFNQCILVLAMDFLASTALHSGSQSLFQE